MNTTINTHRVYDAIVTLVNNDGEESTIEVTVCSSILDAEATGIGTKSYCRSQIKRVPRSVGINTKEFTVKKVRVGNGKEVVGVPNGATEFRQSRNSIRANKAVNDNWLAGHAEHIATKIAERTQA